MWPKLQREISCHKSPIYNNQRKLCSKITDIIFHIGKNFSKLAPHFTSYWHCPRPGPRHLASILSVIISKLVLTHPSSPFSNHLPEPSVISAKQTWLCSNTFSAFCFCQAPNSWACLTCPVFQPLTFPTQMSPFLSTRKSTLNPQSETNTYPDPHNTLSTFSSSICLEL